MSPLIRNHHVGIYRAFSNYGHAGPPVLPPLLLISLLWMMGSVLYIMGKIMKKFSDFIFQVIIENWGDGVTKMGLFLVNDL